MSTVHAPASTRGIATPVVTSAAQTLIWLAAAFVIALGLFYFIGVDQGAYSVFGNDTHIHEFVHDSRHFLGFPCH